MLDPFDSAAAIRLDAPSSISVSVPASTAAAGSSETGQLLTPTTDPSGLFPVKRTSPRPTLGFGPSLTPVTTNHSSPPQKVSPSDRVVSVSGSDRISARPPDGHRAGLRLVYDPDRDRNIDRKHRRDVKPRYEPIVVDANERPPPDPRLAISGYTTGSYMRRDALNKQRLRVTPYLVRPYRYDPATSVGRAEVVQVVVSGFDISTPQNQLRALFGSFGTIDQLVNHSDPITGSLLGICTIRYSDSASGAHSAAHAAARAEKEGNRMRIGGVSVSVKCDPQGRRSARLIEDELGRRQSEHRLLFNPVTKPIQDSRSDTASIADPAAATFDSGSSSSDFISVEDKLVLDSLGRRPYIFIQRSHVPVLPSTIPHMRRRFAMYNVRAIRADRTGYYITFSDSVSGQEECVRCFRECNNKSLFVYTMKMECQHLGNPDRQRTPSPRRVVTDARWEKVRQTVTKQMDDERRAMLEERARRLDPVRGALEQLMPQFRNFILDDIKKRIVMPTLAELLDPAKNAQRRQKYGIPDPSPSRPAPQPMDSAAARPWQQRLWGSHPSSRSHESGNVFLDERRRTSTYRRPAPIALHRRLHNFHSSDDEQERSDDEDDDSRRSRSSSRSISTSRSPSRSLSQSSVQSVGLDPVKKLRTGESVESEPESNDDTGPAEAKEGEFKSPIRKRRRIVSGDHMDVDEPELPKKVVPGGGRMVKKPDRLDKKVRRAARRIHKLRFKRGILDHVSQHGMRAADDPPASVLGLEVWQNLVKDDEDLSMLQMALDRLNIRSAPVDDVAVWGWREKTAVRPEEGQVKSDETRLEIQGYYVPNQSGCARTDGVRRIVESEKSKYLPHRIRVAKQAAERKLLARTTGGADAIPTISQPAISAQVAAASGRSNRANNRRLIFEINTHRKAIAAATNEPAGESIAIRFNALKKRKKLVKFDRSAIHNWGLYAEERIGNNDMIIEYVGEMVRPSVAAVREVKYKRAGIGSSYLFRVDEDYVIDATKHGGIARFINHSCTPNCTAKIIRVEGTKRIVIYAARDIEPGEEITYDYKFERELDEDNRVPCLCGSAGCKGFLN